MISQRLIDIATRHQVFLERLKTGQARATAKDLEEAQTRLVSIMMQLEDQRISEMTRRKFDELAAEMAAVEKKLMDKSVGQFDSNLRDFTGYEIEFEAKSIDRVLRNADLDLPTATKVYKAALRQPAYTNGDLLEGFMDSISTNAVKQTNRMLNRAYVEGWTVQEAVQALRGTKAANYRDGITAIKTRQAEAVVRTALQSVSSAARFQTWSANSDIIEGYEWVATLDSKTTPICRSLDGQSFALGKGPKPPAHVNCRSTTVPDFDDGLDFLDKGATRSSVNGPVDAGLSYYDWLATQPKGFQDLAIGPERGKLFREGGLSVERFRDLQLDKKFQPLTLDEMRKLEPHAFDEAGL